MTLKQQVQDLSAKLDEQFGAGSADRLFAALSAASNAGMTLKDKRAALAAQLGIKLEDEGKGSTETSPRKQTSEQLGEDEEGEETDEAKKKKKDHEPKRVSQQI